MQGLRTFNLLPTECRIAIQLYRNIFKLKKKTVRYNMMKTIIKQDDEHHEQCTTSNL